MCKLIFVAVRYACVQPRALHVASSLSVPYLVVHREGSLETHTLENTSHKHAPLKTRPTTRTLENMPHKHANPRTFLEGVLPPPLAHTTFKCCWLPCSGINAATCRVS